MPTISFQEEFVPAVKSGTKSQTIRPAGKRVYKPGDRLFMYTGPYRKGERVKIGEGVVAEVVPISVQRVDDSHTRIVKACGQPLAWQPAARIATADGFDTLYGFWNFFINTYKLKPGDSKNFVIIKWTGFEAA